MKLTLEVYLSEEHSGADVALAVINTVSDLRFLYALSGRGTIQDRQGRLIGNWQAEQRKGMKL